MTQISTKPPSGMRDFLAPAVQQRRYVTAVVQQVYESFGFVPLETPTLENLTTLLGKYGEEGDQLLYRVLLRREALQRVLGGGEVRASDLADLGLRYDLTVPLARICAEYGAQLPRFYRRYQIQPVWRADRPGKGRFREFYQCDVDITGTHSLMAEADVCAAVATVLHRLGFHDFVIECNHRVLLREMLLACGVAAELEASALVAVDKLAKIGVAAVQEELVARGVSAAAAAQLLALCSSAVAESPAALWQRLRQQLTQPNAQAALDELEALQQLLQPSVAGAHWRFSPTLARGLGYYTGAIFEITVPDLAGSLGGGGRYDGLVGMFGKSAVPAVGFSLGLERILLVMQERRMYPRLKSGAQVMLCWFQVPQASVLHVAAQLRAQGLAVEVFPEAAKLAKQMQYATHPSVGAPVAAILGETEWAAQSITLKNLARGEQVEVPLAQAAQVVQEWLANTSVV